MPESRGAQDSSLSPSEEALSGEALYKQAMAHYRRREWRQAREDFLRLKAAEPGRRGIEAVLDELAIFIHLDSLDHAIAPTSHPAAQPRPARSPLLVAAGPWRVPVGITALVVAVALPFLIYNLVTARAAKRIRDLHGVARTHMDASDWSRAIDAYEEWLLLAPADADARDGLWVAYYARGDQRAAAAQSLEEQEEYARAAEQWQGALADFRAAQQVAPDHEPDPRGAPAARIGVAENGRRCASLLGQALALRSQRRWPEVIYALEAVQTEDAAYSRGRVASYLGEAFLESGQEALAAADTPGQIEEAVRLIGRAAEVQPDASWAQMALWQAQHYLQGVTSVEAQQWDAAVLALEPLLREPVDLTGGRAHTLLCRAQTERADERYGAGRLLDALADYQAVVERCNQDPRAQGRVEQITLALTPTPAPTPWPTPTLAPAPVLTATPAP